MKLRWEIIVNGKRIGSTLNKAVGRFIVKANLRRGRRAVLRPVAMV